MGEVLEFPDSLSYEMQGDDIACVVISNSGGRLAIARNGTIDSNYYETLDGVYMDNFSKNEIKQLMIAWLALEYPECLVFDEQEKSS